VSHRTVALWILDRFLPVTVSCGGVRMGRSMALVTFPERASFRSCMSMSLQIAAIWLVVPDVPAELAALTGILLERPDASAAPAAAQAAAVGGLCA
jgi:hypothetical protein